MADLDPNDHEIGELGPKINDIDDPETLEEILASEEAGRDRENVKTLIQSRIDDLNEDESEGEIDPTELTVAELGNAIQNIDDINRLERISDAETKGQDRDTATNLIDKRIDSLTADEEAEETEDLPPEEKHPDLDHPTADKQYVTSIENGTYRDMWVYCETQHGELVDVSKEMLGKARELMDGYNDDYGVSDEPSEASETPSRAESEQVVGVLIGNEVGDLAEEVIASGADAVVVFEDSRLERFRHKPYAEAFANMVRGQSEAWGYDEPRYVLFPATNNGRDLSAQVQAELDSGLASDCSGLYIEEAMISNPAKTGKPGSNSLFERVLHMKRPDFSGFEYSKILCLDNPDREFHPQGASVIPGSFEAPDPDPKRKGEVIEHDLDLDDDWLHVEVTDHDTLDTGIDLTGHEVVVAVGRGIGDDPTEGLELGLELTDAFEDAAFGLSRGVVTATYEVEGHVEEYVTEERQIGETGQVVEPDLYIAAGISGAVQHKVGMDEAETIVSINTDPDARIKDFSDYYIEGDLFEVLPRLTEALETGELEARAVADGAGPETGGDD